jgi:hypothetical protein
MYAVLLRRALLPSLNGLQHQEPFVTDSTSSFLDRISLAFGTFFAVLSDREFASRLQRFRFGADSAQTKSAKAPAAATSPLKEPTADAALQLLALLQREARLVDFLEEDIAAYPDADIGVAARLVHEGCRKVLREHFTMQPVREEPEGSRVTLDEGFDAAAIRVTGNVVGAPPFRGSISHRGWRVTAVRLPRLAETHDTRVIAPAEVEL